jgi:hypothetical protein
VAFIGDAGVGNEDVDRPESLDGECDAGSNGFFVGDVAALNVESGVTLANGVWDLERAEVICCYFASLVCIQTRLADFNIVAYNDVYAVHRPVLVNAIQK